MNVRCPPVCSLRLGPSQHLRTTGGALGMRVIALHANEGLSIRRRQAQAKGAYNTHWNTTSACSQGVCSCPFFSIIDLSFYLNTRTDEGPQQSA
jgi:hypothetical protein